MRPGSFDDPAGQGLEAVRRIRDEIDERVQRLVAELDRVSAAGPASRRRGDRHVRARLRRLRRRHGRREDDQLGHVGVAITFGLVIMAMIYAVGHVSGAHFNPAVTFAFALTRHFPWPRAVAYWGAQLAGALAAAALLRASLGDIAHVGATLPVRLRRAVVPLGGRDDARS